MSRISFYPLKGCTAIDLVEAPVEPWGLAGDRRWLVVNPAGVAITQRDVAALALLRAEPDLDGLKLSMPGIASHAVVPGDHLRAVTIFGTTLMATSAGAEAGKWLSEALGCPCELVWLDDPNRRSCGFADEYPVLLANAASLTRLNDWVLEGDYPEEAPLPMNRFRPNIEVEGASAFAEDGWIGSFVHIGQMTFRVAGHCSRCLVTTTDQHTADRGREPLRVLARHRKVGQELRFGVNLVPVGRGTIRLGDQLKVQAT